MTSALQRRYQPFVPAAIVRFRNRPAGSFGANLTDERMSLEAAIINVIDASPLNRGLSGRDWLDHEGNVPIVDGDDVALFDDEGDCVYEMHVLFASRGRAAVNAAKAAINRMFEDYGAEVIFALVPDARRDVKMLARWTGLKFIGSRLTSNGYCDLFVISKRANQ